MPAGRPAPRGRCRRATAQPGRHRGLPAEVLQAAAGGHRLADRRGDAANARNREYAERADEINERRRAKARTRMIPAARVAVPRPVGPTTIRRVHACLVDVSKTLGHSSVSITSDIYGHLQERRTKHISKQAAGAIPRRSRTA